MYSYIYGKITEVRPDSITIDNNNIGYDLITPNPYEYKINEELRVYVYQNVKEDSILLYGFRKKEEKEMFVKLLSVKGIGPKGANAILASGSVSSIIDAIEAGNSDYLKKFPGIGPKASQQIILDLKGKVDFNTSSTVLNYNLLDVEDALKALGYSSREIKKVLPKLDGSKPTDVLIKEVLGLLLK